jgi:hypothetical protein
MAFIPDVRLDFDSLLTPCNDVVMPDRKLRMVGFIGSTLNTGYCDALLSGTTGKVSQAPSDRRPKDNE